MNFEVSVLNGVTLRRSKHKWWSAWGLWWVGDRNYTRRCLMPIERNLFNVQSKCRSLTRAKLLSLFWLKAASLFTCFQTVGHIKIKVRVWYGEGWTRPGEKASGTSHHGDVESMAKYMDCVNLPIDRVTGQPQTPYQLFPVKSQAWRSTGLSFSVLDQKYYPCQSSPEIWWSSGHLKKTFEAVVSRRLVGKESTIESLTVTWV